MKKWMRCLALAMGLTLLLSTASAVEVSGWLTNVCCYPEGSTEADATYVYRYSYPVFSGEEEGVEGINTVYEYEAEYIETFTLPMNGEMYGAGDAQYYTNLTSEVTYISQDYVSVKLSYADFNADTRADHMAGHVFALNGVKAGSIISLPYLLDALEIGEDDEWLVERQTNKCDTCVRGLVWEQLQDMAAAGTVTLCEDVDEEYFDGTFYP